MRLHTPVLAATALAATLFGSCPALAWGRLGHRVTGEIAQHYLTPAARTQVTAILGTEDLAEASNYADVMRADPSTFWQKTASPWHYVTVPPHTHYGDVAAPPEGDAVTALAGFARTLRDPKASHDDKALALRFTVHIIGDLQQPLHAGNGTDKGGNDVRVNWFGRSTNLHSVWDSDMIDGEGLSYTEMTAWLLRRITPADRTRWSSVEPRDWIAESAALRDGIYPAQPSLSYDYSFANLPVAERRLAMGGVRIAAYLNDLFAPKGK